MSQSIESVKANKNLPNDEEHRVTENQIECQSVVEVRAKLEGESESEDVNEEQSDNLGMMVASEGGMDEALEETTDALQAHFHAIALH